MSFVRSIAIYSLADIISRAMSLITSPIMTRLLLPAQYGAMGLLGSYWSIFSLASSGGMDSAYPFYRAKILSEDGDAQRRLLATVHLISMAACAVVWLLFSLFMLYTGVFGELAGVRRLELALFCLQLIPTTLVIWNLYLLRFLHYAGAFARVSLISRILGVLVSLPFMALFMQQDRLIAFYLSASLVNLIGLIWSYREFARQGLKLWSPADFDGLTARGLLKFGLILVPSNMLYAFASNADRLLIGVFRGPAEVAQLTLALGLGSAFLIFKQWFSMVWDPYLVEWVAHDRPEWLQQRLQLVIGLLTALFSCLSLLSMFWAAPFIHLMYPKYYHGIAKLIPLLGLSAGISSLSLVAVATILIASRPTYSFWAWGSGLVVNLGSALLLIPEKGVLGAVYASLLGECAILLVWILLGRVVLKNLTLNWLTAVLCFGTCYGIFLLTERGLPQDGHWAIRIAATVLILGVVWVYLKREQDFFLSLLRRG